MTLITRLDRLARSVRDLLEIVERIRDAGAGLRSLAEPWADTTTPAGRMVLTVFGGMAEFERSLIVERTSSGRAAAKARGTKFGRKPKLEAAQLKHIYQLVDEGAASRQEIADLFDIDRSTLYRALSQRQNAAT
nr:recombinase family protein [Pandoraea sputorum]